MFNLLFSKLNYAKNFDTLFNRDNIMLQEILNEEDIKTGFSNPSDAMTKL